MVSAQCSNCGRMMWNVPDDEYDPITTYDVEEVPAGAVGGRVWCNRSCYDEWNDDAPEL